MDKYMDKYKQIENLFEDFKHISGEFSGDLKYFDYVAPDSMHSGITALGYGKRLKLTCVDVTNAPLSVKFNLKKAELSRRFYVRLTACMPNWRKYLNNLKITVNGQTVYDSDKTLFENVCVGWPVTYYPFDGKLLKAGENVVTVSTSNVSGGGLYVAKLSLLTLPEIKDFTQISSLRYARLNNPFTVAVKSDSEVNVLKSVGLKIDEIKKSTLSGSIILIKCRAYDKSVCLTLGSGDKTLNVVCPVIVADSDDKFLVGADNDDYRQDYSEEGTRIPEIFALTAMGNYFQFRPSLYRSAAELPDKQTFINRTKWLYDFNIKVSICDPTNDIGYLADVNPDMFEGKHCHETYLYFSEFVRGSEWGCGRFFIDMDKIGKASTYGECKKLYLDALDKMIAVQHADEFYSSCGCPSLLVFYEAPKFKRVTMEPVSGVNLLTGATRAAANGKRWGAHIPICWYYGYYNDACKSRKYRNTMFYCYLNGADYVYAENGLFKSQSMSREDWDTEFSILNRRYTREMFDYSITHPRVGKLQIPFAAVYGNNEYILWQKSSRIPELKDAKDWDLNVWGKWKDKCVYGCWRAVEAWLPVAENQNTVDDEFNLSLHSGTIFGSVDVTPYEGDYGRYKFIAFFGWNTYETGLKTKLYGYLSGGGTVLISYCHFNKTDNVNGEFSYDNQAVKELTGLNFHQIVNDYGTVKIGDKSYNLGGVKLFSARVAVGDNSVEPFIVSDSGNVIIYRKKTGRGTLYFCTFAEYYGDNEGATDIMKAAAKEISYTVCSSYIDNANVAYTERVTDGGERIFNFINMSSKSENEQSFTLTLFDGGKKIVKTLTVKTDEIKDYVYKK